MSLASQCYLEHKRGNKFQNKFIEDIINSILKVQAVHLSNPQRPDFPSSVAAESQDSDKAMIL